MTPPDYSYICALLKERSGLLLSADKHYLVESRLVPVAQKTGLANLGELVKKLRAPNSEALIVDVVEAMTTNESFFFRDKSPFEHFSNVVLPKLCAARTAHKRIRIWCAAASTGQEPYSLAMAIKEMGSRLDGYRIEIAATDISTEVLEKAKAGIYNQFEVQRGLPIQMLVKYFNQIGEMWQIASDLRAMVQFRQLNLLQKFSQLGQFDVVFCRNVLIYFDLQTKIDVLERISKITASDGYLMLGAPETVIGLTTAFKAVPEHRGLYAPHNASQDDAVVVNFQARRVASLR